MSENRTSSSRRPIKKGGMLIPALCNVIGTLLIIGGSIVVAEILVRYYGIPIVTAFLAMAPGGMTEMCLAGMSMGADVSIILTYQIVRLLMMNLTVPFFIHKYFDENYTG